VDAVPAGAPPAVPAGVAQPRAAAPACAVAPQVPLAAVGLRAGPPEDAVPAGAPPAVPAGAPLAEAGAAQFRAVVPACAAAPQAPPAGVAPPVRLAHPVPLRADRAVHCARVLSRPGVVAPPHPWAAARP
jgi:hypothetical protein